MNGGMMSKIYSNILLDLKNVEGVKILALGSRDGFLINGNTNDDSEMLTLMSAAMLRAAETITNKFERESPNRLTVDFNGGKLITTSAGPKALISVVTSKDAKIDHIFSELEKTAEKIKDIM